jgi:hypothetical protein
MAWQYFTDWLEEGQIITLDQRNELLDAFKERVDALDTVRATIDGGELALVKDSHQQSDRITMFTQISGNLERIALAEGIRRLSRYYFIDGNLDQNYSITLNSNFFLLRMAALDLGYTTEQFADISGSLRNSSGVGGSGSNSYTIARYNNFRHWNIIRRAIQMLKWSDLSEYFTFSGERKEGAFFADWEDAKTDFFDATPTAVTLFTELSLVSVLAVGGDYRIRNDTRGTFELLLNLPLSTIFDKYSVAFNPETSPSHDNAATLRLDITGNDSVEWTVGSTTQVKSPVEVNEIEGRTNTLKVYWAAQEDDLLMDSEFFPNTNTRKSSISSLNNTWRIAPDFTHPFEEIDPD